MALSDNLISSQVGVVRGGDEVVAERLFHVLVHRRVGLVEHAAVFGLHVPEEPFKCHGPTFSGCKRRKEKSNTGSIGSFKYNTKKHLKRGLHYLIGH